MRCKENRARPLAKALRGRMPKAEVILWSRLRRNGHGFRIRRQHPVGPYIADFACVPGRLVIEVDGATHASDKEVAYDNGRDAYLYRLGWRVMRIRNEDIYRNLDTVLDAIWTALHAPSAHLQPAASMGTSPARGGGEGKVW